MDFLGSRWMETAPTSIEVLLRPTLGQSDKPSDLRGSLSPTSVYSTWQSPSGHPSNYQPGATSLNFSDRANQNSILWQMSLVRELSYFCWVHLDRRFSEDLDTFQGGMGHLGEDFVNVHILPNSLVQILPTA